tara:strand:+ start:258 stop:911 length:654 start_codon:yes stop_codon:yes gene_type:complete
MKLYAISGLGADQRVYQYLNIDYELIHLDWIRPIKNEGITDYTMRLSQGINTSEPFGIIGLSFGGLVAIEMSKQLDPKITILISSAETKYELRSIYRLFGKTHLIKLAPLFCFNMPRKIAYFLFGAKNKKLLKEILDDADMYFTKWAISKLITWENTAHITNIIKLSGSEDKLLPPSKDENTILIKGGEHFMIVDKSDEISITINNYKKAEFEKQQS